MPDPFKTLLAIDFDRWAAATYVANFPDVPTLQRRVEDCISMLPDADVITGGFPCQPHSVAGERKASADERDGGEALLLAVEKVRPRQVLAENVAGLVTSEGGKYFTWFVGRLERAGYHIQWRLLDSVNYGVPQFRNRLWIWGIRLDVPAVHCWPAPTHAWPPPTEGLFGGHGLLPGVTVGQALNIDGHIHKRRGASLIRRDHPTNEPHPTLEVGADRKFHFYDHGAADPSTPCPTIKAGGNVDASGHQGGACPPAIPVHSHPADGCEPDETGHVTTMPWNVRTNPHPHTKHPINHPDRPGVTQRSGGSGHSAHRTKQPANVPDGTLAGDDRRHLRVNGVYVRRLTPEECLRLQSGPDDFKWPEKITKTAKYKIIGNGQCSLMMHHLARALQQADAQSHTVISLFCGGGVGDCGLRGKYWSYETAEPQSGICLTPGPSGRKEDVR